MAKKKAAAGRKRTADKRRVKASYKLNPQPEPPIWWVKIPPIKIPNPAGGKKITLYPVLGISLKPPKQHIFYQLAYVKKYCPTCDKCYCVPAATLTCPLGHGFSTIGSQPPCMPPPGGPLIPC